MKEHQDLVRVWRQLPGETEIVLATVVSTRGSVYRRPGARMLLTRDGWLAGSISGGCIESDLVQSAFDRTEEGAALVTYDSTAPDDILFGFGVGCSGQVQVLLQRLDSTAGPLPFLEQVEADRRPGWLAVHADGHHEFSWEEKPSGGLLIERIHPSPALVVFGAGHDAIPLVSLAKQTGWHVMVVDGRSAYAQPDRFVAADIVRICQPNQVLELEPGCAAVVMTHSYVRDLEILRWLVDSTAGYIGVLGPRARTQRLADELGIGTDRLNAPVGLDLGAEGPEEIALAILSELVAVRSGRNGGFLNGLTAPLHNNSQGSSPWLPTNSSAEKSL